jgi:hypothetical protein
MEKRYWIAINGPSCAISSIPFSNPITSPVAYQYIGFRTYAEARQAQKICLHGTEAEMESFFRVNKQRVRSGDIRVIQPPAPQPWTKGPTLWMEAETGEWMAKMVPEVFTNLLN